LDFCCVELKFVVEIDGQHHTTAAGQAHDVYRDQFLKGLGYQVLRIMGFEILRDSQAVWKRIDTAVQSRIAERRLKRPSPIKDQPDSA
jgi:very-short-patch-repair endonuclease